MAYTISDLKTDLEAILHGTTLNKVVGVNNLINRAAADFMLDVDPQETKRKTAIANPIFDQVYDYVVPSDLKGNKIVDLRPQVNRNTSDNFSQTYTENFDLYKDNDTFQINYNNGIKTIRIAKELTPGATLNECNSITDNGLWFVGDSGTNLRLDNLNYVSGNASLRFDLDGSSATGFIENDTMTPVDLKQWEYESSIFVWLYMPTTLIDVTFQWGSSNADYWTRTVTVAHDGTAFQNGWNLLRFDWDGATVVGAPDATIIDYLKVLITYSGVATMNYRLDSIVAKLGTLYDMVYYSRDMFLDGITGAFKENVTNDADIVNLESDSRNLLLYKCAELAAQQIQSEDATFDYQFFANKYQECKKNYTDAYKSEIIKPKQNYYDFSLYN